MAKLKLTGIRQFNFRQLTSNDSSDQNVQRLLVEEMILSVSLVEKQDAGPASSL